MKILFMGTPDIAKTVLADLYEAGHYITAVITQPDKPKGRGNTLTKPPVKVWAEEHGIAVYQPQTLKTDEATELVKSMEADVAVVVAYGKLLPVQILEAFKYGCINVHASLLPKYRGAAPIQRCIMDGETVTGVCTMQMDAGLDTGDILITRAVDIADDTDCGQLTEKLAVAGAEAMRQTLEQIENGTLTPIKQTGESTYAAKVEKSELMIDFSLNAKKIHDLIRGVYPNLCAYTYIETSKGKKQLKLVKTSYEPDGVHGEPGCVIECDDKKNILAVACGQGVLYIHELTPEGKNKMRAADFIRGRGICKGDILTVK